jgi:hypothetical protein
VEGGEDRGKTRIECLDRLIECLIDVKRVRTSQPGDQIGRVLVREVFRLFYRRWPERGSRRPLLMVIGCQVNEEQGRQSVNLLQGNFAHFGK